MGEFGSRNGPTNKRPRRYREKPAPRRLPARLLGDGEFLILDC